MTNDFFILQNPKNSLLFHFIWMYSLLNEDPNQQAYQDNNDQSNSINHNGVEDKFDFATNLFEQQSNEVESDDFYGRTREIIIFAEKGKNEKFNGK